MHLEEKKARKNCYWQNLYLTNVKVLNLSLSTIFLMFKSLQNKNKNFSFQYEKFRRLLNFAII